MYIENKKYYLFLFFILLFIFSIRFPFYRNTVTNPDIGNILYNGMLISEGKKPYIDSLESKMPLPFIITGILYKIFPLNALYYNLFMGLWVTCTAFIIFLIIFEFAHPRVALMGTSIFGFSVSYGNLSAANYTTWMILPISLSIYYVIRFIKTDKHMFLFYAGIFSALAILSKVTALFNLISIILFLFCYDYINRKYNFSSSKKYLFFCVGFVLVFLSFMSYFHERPIQIIQQINPLAYSDYALGGNVFDLNSEPVKYSGTMEKFMDLILVYSRVSLFIIKEIKNIWILWIFLLFSVFIMIQKSIKLNLLYVFLFLNLVFAFLGTISGGRMFDHYLPQYYLSASIVSVICLKSILFTKQIKFFIYSILLTALIFLLIINKPVYSIINSQNPHYETGLFIKGNSEVNDTIFVFDVPTQIYFYSQRFSPSIYYKPYPFIKSYALGFKQDNDAINLILIPLLNSTRPKFLVSTNYAIKINESVELTLFIDNHYFLTKEIEHIRIFQHK